MKNLNKDIIIPVLSLILIASMFLTEGIQPLTHFIVLGWLACYAYMFYRTIQIGKKYYDKRK